MTPVTQAERIDLLLELLQRYLVIVPHTDELLDGVVIAGRDVDAAVGPIGKALSYPLCVPRIRLYSLTFACHHRGWSKNDTFNSLLFQLLVQRKTQTTGLVAAEKLDVVAKFLLQTLDVLEHVPDVRFTLCAAENLILTPKLRLKRTKREIRTMDIHANIDYPLHVKCPLLHYGNSLCCVLCQLLQFMGKSTSLQSRGTSYYLKATGLSGIMSPCKYYLSDSHGSFFAGSLLIAY